MAVQALSKRQPLWIWVLLLSWLLSVVAAFWWFQGRDLRAFYPQGDERYALFKGESLRHSLWRLVQQHEGPALSEYQAWVVHFYSPDCACNRFNRRHLEQLIEAYSGQGVKFLILPPPQALHDEHDRAALRADFPPSIGLIDTRRWRFSEWIPASPAVAILNKEGALVYFGPYSLGAVCTASDQGFVEQMLDGLLKGDRPEWRTIGGYGCFCDWASA